LSKNNLRSRISKVYTTGIHSSILLIGNLKANHFHSINFLALLKFGKHRTSKKTLLNHFPASELWITAHHLPGKNRKVGTRLILQPCPGHYVLRLSRLKFWIVIVICSLVLQAVCGFTELITQQYINVLSNSIFRHNMNALLLRNVAQQSLLVAGAQLS